MRFFRISGETVAAESETGAGGDDDRGVTEMYRTVGIIRTTHGIRGEVKVIPCTGFPELRFGKVL
jgi:RimM N-terminal domain